MLSKTDIQQRITKLKTDRNEEIGIDAAYVLTRLVEIDRMDVIDILNDDLTIKPIIDWPLSWRRIINFSIQFGYCCCGFIQFI